MVFKVLAIIATFALCLNGLRLNCGFRMRTWPIIGEHYSCYPATFINDGNSTHILSVTGDHLSGKSNTDVKAVDVVRGGLQLSSMPKGIEEFFPNLAGFEWYNGNLTTVISEDLRPFPELELISLPINKLTSLDGDLFVHTPKIGYLDFYNNQLQNVGYGLLDGLNSLKTVKFESNPCINFQATTPATIQQLKIKLRDQCPPLIPTTTSTTPTTTSATTTRTTPTTTSTTVSTTTDSGFCSIGCVELIEAVEDENVRQDDVIAALQAENAVLRIEISGLQEQINAQHEKDSAHQEQISVQGDAIAELEMQMREFWSSPCSPCVASQYAAQVDQE